MRAKKQKQKQKQKLVSSPRVSVGDLSFCKRATTTNNRFPTTTFGNDNNRKCHPRGFGGPQGSGICCLPVLFIDWSLMGLKDPYKRVLPSGSKKGLTRFFFDTVPLRSGEGYIKTPTVAQTGPYTRESEKGEEK